MATTIDMTDANNRRFVAVVTLRGQLRILSAGMTIRGLSAKRARELVAVHTGYPVAKSNVTAIRDCTAFIELAHAARRGESVA
jgi:hypothetical protein